MDYGNFSETARQEEGIKIKIKVSKHMIGEKKSIYTPGVQGIRVLLSMYITIGNYPVIAYALLGIFG